MNIGYKLLGGTPSLTKVIWDKTRVPKEQNGRFACQSQCPFPNTTDNLEIQNGVTLEAIMQQKLSI